MAGESLPLVDDDDNLRSMLEAALSHHGFEVTAFEDGRKALEAAPEVDPDLVVLDAAVRSWAPIDPVCLRWDFPLWYVDEDADPKAFEGMKKPKAKGDKDEPAEPSWTVVRFVDELIDEDEPRTAKDLEQLAKSESGLGVRKVRNLINEALHAKLIALVQSPNMDGRGRPKKGYVKAPGSDLWN